MTQKDPETENPGISDLYRVGTIAYIKHGSKASHDLLRVLVEGLGESRAFISCSGRNVSGSGNIRFHCRKGLNMQTLCGRLCTENSWSVSSVLYGKRQGQPGAGSPDHEYRKP